MAGAGPDKSSQDQVPDNHRRRQVPVSGPGREGVRQQDRMPLASLHRYLNVLPHHSIVMPVCLLVGCVQRVASVGTSLRAAVSASILAGIMSAE